MSLGPILALLFCFVVAVFALRRAYQLYSWTRAEGKVQGPADSSNDSSYVRIAFVDREGTNREFTSGVSFGHSVRAKSADRIPFQTGQLVPILVNPKDPTQAELASPMLYSIPAVLLLLTGYLAYTVILPSK